MKLDGKKLLMVIPRTQFRDEEFFGPKKILEDEGAKVVVASTAVRTCYGDRDCGCKDRGLRRAGHLRRLIRPGLFLERQETC
jgi:putative intracellular protease/amidase